LVTFLYQDKKVTGVWGNAPYFGQAKEPRKALALRARRSQMNEKILEEQKNRGIPQMGDNELGEAK
jgi:hypothetical protein